MKKPNFFIIGAPKCGTTALASYLSEHPDIFFSPYKEPHYFCTDFSDSYRQFTTEQEYLHYCFGEAENYHKAVGEGSTRYLVSKNAIPNIYEYNSESKLIVMLRNPVELIHSYFYQQLIDYNESLQDFKQAWQAQYKRKRGHDIPSICQDPKLVYYKEIGLLGDQVERLLNIFPRSQVQFILYEEFSSDTLNVYKKVLSFLDVPYRGRTNFTKVNVSKKYRFRWLARAYRRKPFQLHQLIRKVKSILNLPDFGLEKRLNRFNQQEFNRPPISPEMRNELHKTFDDDIHKLSLLLNKNLDHWLE